MHLTTSDTGAALSSIDDDPWGQVERGAPARFGFTGELQQGSSVHLRARWYNAASGSFASVDPYAGDPANPASLAPYMYAYNQPTRFTDPSGRCVPEWIPFIGEPGCNAWRDVLHGESPDWDSLGKVGEAAAAPIMAQANEVTEWIEHPVEKYRDFLITNVLLPPGAAQSIGMAQGLTSIAQDLTTCHDPYRTVRGLASAGLLIASLKGIMQSTRGGPSLTTESTLALLKRLARQADQTTPIPPGTTKTVAGTLIHTTLAQLVRALNRADLTTEVNYFQGRVVLGNIKGSVRLDIVEGPLNSPIAVYDLKTGVAGLTAKRIAQIRANLPNNGILPNGQPIPVIEIRP